MTEDRRKDIIKETRSPEEKKELEREEKETHQGRNEGEKKE